MRSVYLALIQISPMSRENYNVLSVLSPQLDVSVRDICSSSLTSALIWKRRLYKPREHSKPAFFDAYFFTKSAIQNTTLHSTALQCKLNCNYSFFHKELFFNSLSCLSLLSSMPFPISLFTHLAWQKVSWAHIQYAQHTGGCCLWFMILHIVARC